MAVNAAAEGGGPTDLDIKRRPAMAVVFKDLIPDFETKSEERLHERSVIYWADKISAPLLILQGGSDWRTDPGDALTLAQKLQALGKPYELVVYAGDNHIVANNRVDRDRRIVEWFKKHLK